MATTMEAKRFQDLIVWQKAEALAAEVYQASDAWPKEESYGLTGKVRRAAVSVFANIAEGHGRTGPREFQHHLSIAHGSLAEVEALLLFAKRITYLDDDALTSLKRQLEEVRRLLRGLIRSLRTSTPSRQT